MSYYILKIYYVLYNIAIYIPIMYLRIQNIYIVDILIVYNIHHEMF